MMTPFHATRTGDGPGGDSQEEIELDFLPIPELPELPPESERNNNMEWGELWVTKKLYWKVRNIQDTCSSLVGRKIDAVNVLWQRNDKPFVDAPGVYGWWETPGTALIVCGDRLVSVEWWNFDDLVLSNDFDEEEDEQERWGPTEECDLSPAIGKTIKAVWVGGEGISCSIPVQTDFLFELEDDLWLSIYNALDENGYRIYSGKPNGKTLLCCVKLKGNE